jgi:hypothetical protein
MNTITTAQCGSEIVGDKDPSYSAMHSAVQLEIDKALGVVTTQGIGKLIQRAVDAETAKLQSELAAARKALEEIAAIEDQEFGGDWDEIEQARQIAIAALSSKEPEGER